MVEILHHEYIGAVILNYLNIALYKIINCTMTNIGTKHLVLLALGPVKFCTIPYIKKPVILWIFLRNWGLYPLHPLCRKYIYHYQFG